ncbi:MAG: dihydrofolate synthase / folylpolyglutamate synthase [Frankiales bacterium]|nr:dihydrofolate synthase / folylpolyglutamate synthase [Frankiales bacterium]
MTSTPTDGESPEDALARAERALEDRVATRMVPGLPRIEDLLDLLGAPHRAYPSIHVAGTNGKTTTTRMIEALLRELGLRTGRYTSPHLESVTERIAIDGRALTPERFAEVYAEVAPYAEIVDKKHDEPMTYFEVLTGMAFAAFADAPVDVAVVEVGLGGTSDATNVIGAPVAVMTPVALDHMDVLGHTVEAIATDKAGILHEGAFLVTAQQPIDAAEAILRRAVEVGATVAREGLEFGVLERQHGVGGQLLTLRGLQGEYDDIMLPLHGAHQASNAAVALAAVEAFLGAQQALDADAVRAAFAGVTSPGRLETMRTNPTVLLDAAHNPAGAAALVDALGEAFAFSRLVGVVAVLSDKDVLGLLDALEPALDAIVVTTNSSPRALPASELAEIAIDVFGEDRVEQVDRLDEALEAAIGLAEADPDLIGAPGGLGVLVTGSVVTVGEARHLLRGGA